MTPAGPAWNPKPTRPNDMKIHVFLPALAGCLATGCVTHYTTVKDEPRQTVQFASARAAQTFYEAYIRDHYVDAERDHANWSVDLETVPPYERRDLKTDNVLFNEAVQAADANHDGVISEAEARAYAAKVAPGKTSPNPERNAK
jgi:hypothetical protein